MGMDLSERFRRAVRAVFGAPSVQGAPPLYMYMPSYRATVKAVSSDGSHVDVQPEAPWMPAQQNVPLLWGLPAFSTVIQPGAVVRVFFSAGDPQRICAAMFEGGEGLSSPWKVGGDVIVQRYLSSGAGVPTSGGGGLVINAGSTDESGTFTISGMATPGTTDQVNVDITYSKPFPNGSRAYIEPADATAAALGAFTADVHAGGNVLYVDVGNTDKTKFRVRNKAGGGAATAPTNGTWLYRVVGS